MQCPSSPYYTVLLNVPVARTPAALRLSRSVTGNGKEKADSECTH